MTEQEKAIEQLERISHKLGSIGETVDYTEMAIEALKHQKEYQAKVQALQEENQNLYNQMMENEKGYQRALETKEVVAQLQDTTIRMLGSDKDTLIDGLNNRDKYFKKKVQKCIERINTYPWWEVPQTKVKSKVLEIIKEEMGAKD